MIRTAVNLNAYIREEHWFKTPFRNYLLSATTIMIIIATLQIIPIAMIITKKSLMNFRV